MVENRLFYGNGALGGIFDFIFVKKKKRLSNIYKNGKEMRRWAKELRTPVKGGSFVSSELHLGWQEKALSTHRGLFP